MLTWRRTTGLAIVLSAFVVGGYDILAEVFGGNDATISKIHLDVAANHPLFVICVCVLAGILLGHYFLPQTAAVGVVKMTNDANDKTEGRLFGLTVKEWLLIIAALSGLFSTSISAWNNRKAAAVQQHQEANSIKLDETKAAAEGANTHAAKAAVAAQKAADK